MLVHPLCFPSLTLHCHPVCATICSAVPRRAGLCLRHHVLVTTPGYSHLAAPNTDQRPGWMTKPALLAFAGLRSYPLLQLGRLAAALREREMPLAAPAVAALVRMAAYHMGELTDASPPTRAWREDWAEDVLPALLEVRPQCPPISSSCPASFRFVLTTCGNVAMLCLGKVCVIACLAK
jgi:hypothetical protein